MLNSQKKNCDYLTCDVENGVPAPGVTGQTGRHAPVHTRVLLLLAVHRSQEEQAPVRQHDPAEKRKISAMEFQLYRVHIATLPPFGPIEGHEWFDQISIQ
jgi:hypothetical protein